MRTDRQLGPAPGFEQTHPRQLIALFTISSTTDLIFPGGNTSCALFNSPSEALEGFQQKGKKN